MQPYDDLRGHYREAPEETAVVVAMDLWSVLLLGTALAGASTGRGMLSVAAVALGAAFVLWVVGVWTLVADLRDWD